MDSHILQSENITFADTAGISENNASRGFKPAFLDKDTGHIELARLATGQPAPVHIINWLPHEWAMSYHDDGTVKSLKPGVVSGFVCNTVFYTREQVAALLFSTHHTPTQIN